MVAHTGSIGPTVKACTILDECLGKIANTILTLDGTLLIFADHGNAEEMIDPQTGQIGTEHNGNPVPFIAISKSFGKSSNSSIGNFSRHSSNSTGHSGHTKTKHHDRKKFTFESLIT